LAASLLAGNDPAITVNDRRIRKQVAIEVEVTRVSFREVS
jgi:hypothetical protein